MSWLTGACLVIFAIAFAGGLVPLALRRTERVQHLMIAFAAGVFLGAVFLHLLPQVAEMAAGHAGEHAHEHPPGDDGHEHAHAHLHAGQLIWLCVLLGVVLLYLIENLAFRKALHIEGDAVADNLQHRTLGWATFFGLTVHSFTAGLGLSAGVEAEELRTPLLLSVISHKAVEGFSLCAAFLLAGMGRRYIFALLVAFAVVTPLGALGRAHLLPDLEGLGIEVFTGLAAGTFLFVALCDLLPEVFHHRHDTAAKIVLLAAGIAVDTLVHTLVA